MKLWNKNICLTSPITIMIIIALLLCIIPERFPQFKRALEKCSQENLLDYYKVFKLYGPEGYFYSISDVVELKEKVKLILYNFLSIIPFIISIILGLILGGISSMFATIYMSLSTLFNFFYIPLNNPIEMLDIMKDHSSLLTILLCITVIGSSNYSLDERTTQIISSLVAILILYKVITYKK